MNRRKVEDYAFKNGVSFNEAKRRLGKKAQTEISYQLPTRGVAVPGTGKPRGPDKG
jgi:hypothetical protein